jgi:tetratricopeptide (TPR) repeat protein
MKQLLYILLIFHCQLSVVNCFAQNFSTEEQKQIEDLNTIIKNPTSHDTARANAYVGLSQILYILHADTVIVLCQQALTLLEKQPSSLKKKNNVQNIKARALNNIGFIYDTQGLIAEALDYYTKSLKVLEEIGDKADMAYSLNNIGYVYNHQGKISEALDYYVRSLKIFEEIGDKEGIAVSLNNIAGIYDNQGQMTEALDYYKRSLKIQEEIVNKRGVAYSLNNIGAIYDTQGLIAEALDCYTKSLKIREEIGDKEGVAESLNNIGGFHKKEAALSYYLESLKIFEEIANKPGIATSLRNIASIEVETGELDSAKAKATRALQIAQEIGYPKLISKNSKLLCNIAKEQGNWQEALAMYELHIQMRDSIDNEETQKASIRQQTKYEYEKRQVIKDAEHEKQLVIEQEAKAKQKVITYATAGGLLLVLLFTGFIYNRFRVTRKQKIIIEKQKHVVEEAHKEIRDSINYAKRIQNAILPPARIVKEYLPDSFILYNPKDIVAGDFYWLETFASDRSSEFEENIILFAAADCTGHGVPGAMVSVVCNNGLNRSVREYSLTEPGLILDKTREIVIQEFEKSDDEVKDGMDISLSALAHRAQSENGAQSFQLQWAGANNPLWIIADENRADLSGFKNLTGLGGKALYEIKPNKQPIGKVDNPQPFATHTLELQEGDIIYVFTDGYQDQFGGEKGKKFKASQLKELLLSIQDKTMEEQKQQLEKAFEDWKGSLEQIDDVCIVGVRI